MFILRENAIIFRGGRWEREGTHHSLEDVDDSQCDIKSKQKTHKKNLGLLFSLAMKYRFSIAITFILMMTSSHNNSILHKILAIFDCE